MKVLLTNSTYLHAYLGFERIFCKSLDFYSEQNDDLYEFKRDIQSKVSSVIMTHYYNNYVLPKMKIQKEVKLTPSVFNSLVGNYFLPDMMDIRITQENNRLFITFAGTDKCEMFSISETEFFLKIVFCLKIVFLMNFNFLFCFVLHLEILFFCVRKNWKL